MPRKIPTFRPAGFKPAAKTYERMDSRREDRAFYKSAPWRRLRAAFLRRHPLCALCLESGTPTPAEHVHHLVERKKNPDLALDWSNLQALCQPCHNRVRT